MDLYVFATPYTVTWDYYFSAREHTLNIESWEEHAEQDYVKQHGISVFLMPSGMLGTLMSLEDVLPLFSNTIFGQKANLAFLKRHICVTFELRPKPWQATIDPTDVHSGDFLAVSKIRGRWGGFESLEKWVTGAFAGHTAGCLKDEDGKLWIGESGHENEKVVDASTHKKEVAEGCVPTSPCSAFRSLRPTDQIPPHQPQAEWPLLNQPLL